MPPKRRIRIAGQTLPALKSPVSNSDNVQGHPTAYQLGFVTYLDIDWKHDIDDAPVLTVHYAELTRNPLGGLLLSDTSVIAYVNGLWRISSIEQTNEADYVQSITNADALVANLPTGVQAITIVEATYMQMQS